MKDVFLIKKPWVTEKATALSKIGKYVFIVKPSATKNEIKKAIRDLYRVNPANVHIVRKPAKRKHFRNAGGVQAGHKKAIVTLPPGEKIDLGR